jgi:ATP-dependent DNA helicase RecG
MVRFDALKSALIDNVAQGVAQGVAQELTDMQKQILELIRNNPRISRSEIAENIGKSVKTIERRLGEMENFVKFIGSGYSGHWEIVSSADDKK